MIDVALQVVRVGVNKLVDHARDEVGSVRDDECLQNGKQNDLRKLFGARINYIRNDRHVGDDLQDAVPCERVNKTRD